MIDRPDSKILLSEKYHFHYDTKIVKTFAKYYHLTYVDIYMMFLGSPRYCDYEGIDKPLPRGVDEWRYDYYKFTTVHELISLFDVRDSFQHSPNIFSVVCTKTDVIMNTIGIKYFFTFPELRL